MRIEVLVSLVWLRKPTCLFVFPVTLTCDIEWVCHACPCVLQMGWSQKPRLFLPLPPRRNLRQGRGIQPKRTKAARMTQSNPLPSLFCLKDTSLTHKRRWFSPEKARAASDLIWKIRLQWISGGMFDVLLLRRQICLCAPSEIPVVCFRLLEPARSVTSAVWVCNRLSESAPCPLSTSRALCSDSGVCLQNWLEASLDLEVCHQY